MANPINTRDNEVRAHSARILRGLADAFDDEEKPGEMVARSEVANILRELADKMDELTRRDEETMAVFLRDAQNYSHPGQVEGGATADQEADEIDQGK